METTDLFDRDRNNSSDSAKQSDTADAADQSFEVGNTGTTLAADAVAQLRSKYEKQDGKVYEVKTSIQEDDETEKEFDFIFRKPNTSSYDRYVKTTAVSASKALKVFVLDNICEEQKELLRGTLEEYPAMAIGLGEKLLNMLGLSKETTVKKL